MFMKLFRNELMKINSKKQGLFFNIFLILFIALIGICIAVFSKSTAESMDANSFTSLIVMIMPQVVMLFGIVLGAQIVTEEFKDGTIKQLLIRPASRTAVLLSKYAAVVFMFILSFIIMLVASFAIGAILFKTGGDISFMDNVQDVFYIFPFSLFLMTLSFVAGVFTTSLGLSIGIGLFFNVFSSMFGLLAGKYAWSKFVVLKYTSLASYAPGAENSQGITLGFALAITVIYIVAILIASIVRFKTKEIN